MNDKLDQQAKDALLGTWEYLIDGWEGLCMYTETRVFWILVNKDRKSFQGDQPTEVEKAQAFTDSFADICTYTVVGPSRIAIHRLHSTNPNVSDFECDYEIEGDIMRYWPLLPDGSRGALGKARKID